MDEVCVDVEKRLDQIISQKFNISRNQALNLIKNENVFVDDKLLVKPSFIPKIGQSIKIKQDEKQKTIKKDLNLNVEILYEDDDILVVNKPANLATHPALNLKESTLVEWLLDKKYPLSNLGDKLRPGIVHRLDKPTSGGLVIAKNNKSHINLANQFRKRSVGRYYIAAINLALKENLIIDKPIGINPKNRLKKAIIKDGRESKTAFLNLYSNDKINLISAKLFTGRTHQIRVHLSSISRYIMGDILYGFKRQNDKIERLMLHAYILEIDHPTSGNKLRFVANLDDKFTKFIKNKEILDEKISPNLIIDSFRDYDHWMCYNIADV